MEQKNIHFCRYCGRLAGNNRRVCGDCIRKKSLLKRFTAAGEVIKEARERDTMPRWGLQWRY